MWGTKAPYISLRIGREKVRSNKNNKKSEFWMCSPQVDTITAAYKCFCCSMCPCLCLR